MAALLVDTKDKTELHLLLTMLKKMGIRSKVLSDTEREDLALGLLVQKTDRTKKVSRNAIFKKLAN